MSALEVDWHAWRRGGIGGSDIAGLMGLSPYASPTSLFYEKTGALGDDHADSDRQRIGKRMEVVLAAEFNDRTGLYCVGEQTWCQHATLPWARCTVDGFAADSPFGSIGAAGEYALGTVQMKTDGRFGWPDGIPPGIRAQCVWEMGVTGLYQCWLIVMFAGFRVEVFEISWDADVQSDWEYMLSTARAFWVDHVETGVPPAIDHHEATTAALTEVHGVDPAGIADADETARTLVAELQRAKLLTKAAEAAEDRLSNELRALLGDRTDLVDGWTEPTKKVGPKPIVIASWRPQENRRIDTTALRSAEPAIADKFTTTTVTRVLRVTPSKETPQ